MTFESFLTPEGIVVAAGLITTLISLIRTAIPQVANISGALAAFVLSALLYIATAAAVGFDGPNGILTIFAAWLACAVGAVGAHETVTKTVVNRGGDA